MQHRHSIFSSFLATLPGTQGALAEVVQYDSYGKDIPSPLTLELTDPSVGGDFVIPVHGYIFEACKGIYPGCCAPSAILKHLDQAIQAGRSVLLDIDSPGGGVAGVPELAAYILAAVQQGAEITAFTRGTCASAAYWIAAPCASITATRGATIGNCGCYAAFVDFSKSLERSGVITHLFSSGELKAAGYPDVPLTEAQAAFLADHVKAIAEMFFADVRAARPQIDEDAMTSGAWYLANTAQALGFVDQVVIETP